LLLLGLGNELPGDRARSPVNGNGIHRKNPPRQARAGS